MVDKLAPKKIFTQRELDTKLTPVSEQVLRTKPRPSLLDDRPKVVGTATSLIDTQSKDFLLDIENMMPKVATAEQKQTAKSSEETIKEKQTGMRTERQETPQGEGLVMRPIEYAAEGFEDKKITNPVVVGEKGAEMIVPTGDGKFSVLDAKTTSGLMMPKEKPNDSESVEMYKETIRKEEGLRLEKYKPVKTEEHFTIGYGHYGPDVDGMGKITKQQAEDLLDKDVTQRVSEINNLMPDFNSFPDSARDAIFSEYYRGSIAQSPKTVKLINEGKYAEAAREFLNNEEYKNANDLGKPGIRPRMERVANELKKMAGGLGSKP
jgi:GH24 family phage-related lysozyme (muramidase)